MINFGSSYNPDFYLEHEYALDSMYAYTNTCRYNVWDTSYWSKPLKLPFFNFNNYFSRGNNYSLNWFSSTGSSWKPFGFFNSGAKTSYGAEGINFGACTGLSVERTNAQEYDPQKSWRSPVDYAKYGKNGDFIKDLCPVMQDKVMALLDYAKKEGINVEISSGYRSNEKQTYLYNYYRSKGLYKRAAKPGTSPHEFGRAIDIKASKLSDAQVRKLAKYAKEQLGMRWGGDYTNWDTEKWHFDISAAQAGQVKGQKYTPQKVSSAPVPSSAGTPTQARGNSSSGYTNTTAGNYDAILNGTYNADYVKMNGITHLKYSDVSSRDVVTVDGVKMHKDAAEAYKKMKKDAAAEGVHLKPVSTLRTTDAQVRTFKKKFNGKPSITEMNQRALSSAPSGYSEHHTGYAIDFNSTSESFAKTKEYKWLQAHAKEYGFEISFPRGNKQGVTFEPWHWRYVGTSAAKQTFAVARRDFANSSNLA